MQCLTLALDHAAETGEYRVFNQFEEVYGVTDLAHKVQAAAGELGIESEIRPLVNPRVELEDHYYNPDHKHLRDLGYKPTHDVDAELRIMLEDLMKHHDRIDAKRDVLIPDVKWKGDRERVAYLHDPVASA
jgi:UDP-sulfoquinovose synthase